MLHHILAEAACLLVIIKCSDAVIFGDIVDIFKVVHQAGKIPHFGGKINCNTGRITQSAVLTVIEHRFPDEIFDAAALFRIAVNKGIHIVAEVNCIEIIICFTAETGSAAAAAVHFSKNTDVIGSIL